MKYKLRKVGTSLLLLLLVVTLALVLAPSVSAAEIQSNGNITLDGSYTVPERFSGTIAIADGLTAVTIDGGGKVYSGVNINVQATGDFELTLKNIDFTAADGKDAIAYAGASGKTLVLKTEGSVGVAGGANAVDRTAGSASGIYSGSGNVAIDGVCTIVGGKNNKYHGNAQGIYAGGGTVTVSAAATIAGGSRDSLDSNTPNFAGCGIYVERDSGNVVVSGDAVISGGSNSGGNGSCSGVCVRSGTITVSGAAEIRGGSSPKGDRIGNALFVDNGTGIVVTISGNARLTGGSGFPNGSSGNAIYAEKGDVLISGEATLTGGDGSSISTNCPFSGNGVYAQDGNITVEKAAVITGGSNIDTGESYTAGNAVSAMAQGKNVIISGAAILTGGSNCKGYYSANGIYAYSDIAVNGEAVIEGGSGNMSASATALYSYEGTVSINTGAAIQAGTTIYTVPPVAGLSENGFAIVAAYGDISIAQNIPLLIDGKILLDSPPPDPEAVPPVPESDPQTITIGSGAAEILTQRTANIINESNVALHPVSVAVKDQGNGETKILVTVPESNQGQGDGYLYLARMRGSNGTIWLPAGSYTLQGSRGDKQENSSFTVTPGGDNKVALFAPAERGGGGSSSSARTYTVKFDTQGGGAVKSQSVSISGVVTKPEDPAREGYVFNGWFTNKECTVKYDFSAKVTGPFTLYAGWKSAEKDPWKNPFNDVKTGDWFYRDVRYVYENGLMLGTSDTAFSPNAPLSRAMMATVLWHMAGSPEPANEHSFTDLTQDWYGKAIRWAKEKSIVSGYGDGRFGPDDVITREQLVTMLYHYLQIQGNGFKGTWAFPLEFEDAGSVSDWASEAVHYCVMNEIVSGKPGNLFDPQGLATRAELSAILYRYMEIVEK